MRSKSSAQWLQRQHADPFTERSKKEGYRSRAVYKLIEIQEKDKLVSQGMQLVDLGAAPGSWSQLVSQWVGKHGRVIALDILEMAPIKNVEFIQGDFREIIVLEQLDKILNNKTLDLVISDMAPNLSGVPGIDQPRMFYLAEYALEFVNKKLKKGGNFLIKVFQGEGFQEYMTQLRQVFCTVSVRKPKASRSESRELYLLAKNFRG